VVLDQGAQAAGAGEKTNLRKVITEVRKEELKQMAEKKERKVITEGSKEGML
jgi:hypothetical protein